MPTYSELNSLQKEAVDRLGWSIVKRVAELPDRSSPDDWPDAMLVTGPELHEIIASVLADAG